MANNSTNNNKNATLPVIVVEGVLFPGASIKIPVKSETNIKMLKSHFIETNKLASNHEMLLAVFPIEKLLASCQSTTTTAALDSARPKSKMLNNSNSNSNQHRHILVRDVDQCFLGQNLAAVHKIGTIGAIVDIFCENDKQTSRYSITVTGVCRAKLIKVVSDTHQLNNINNNNQHINNYLIARVQVLAPTYSNHTQNTTFSKSPLFQLTNKVTELTAESGGSARNSSSESPDALNVSFKYLRALAWQLIENVYSASASKTSFETKLMFQSFASLTDEDLTDMFAAIVHGSHEEKLAILDSIELSERARRTIQLIKRHIDHIKAFQNKLQLVEDDEVDLDGDNAEQNKSRRKDIDNSWLNNRQQTANADTKNAVTVDDQNGLFETDVDDHALLIRRLRSADLPEPVRRVTSKEMSRLRRMPNHMPEYAIIRGYLELVADLPWSIVSEEHIDLVCTSRDLDADHHGLHKLKERVLQYLAVRKLRQASSSLSLPNKATTSSQPILFFVGPPGTGKTSIARSIANSLGRKFQRISLGGVADQSDIRGHRRTYIGSMPGRIIQGLKQAGVNNPVFLLDELDKLSPINGVHGDPSAALLEVLDPEQNHSFTDHYLNVPFDLSNVLFIATANSLNNISPALLDRMEVIQVHGYTHDEKFDIARKHLIPKQVTENGLNDKLIVFRDDAVHKLIAHYAYEPGVRNLNRKIAAVCRVVAVRIVNCDDKRQLQPGQQTGKPADKEDDRRDQASRFVVDAASLDDLIGPPMFDSATIPRQPGPGLAIGLAWTPAGGEIMFVEAEIIAAGSNAHLTADNLILTGQLGSVMRESARIALNWIRANCLQYSPALNESLAADLISNTVHVHFPQGAVSKDGPSAGVAIIVALMSHASGKALPVDLAMTGEITLRGQVLRVGGVKAKVLAAHRAGIKRIILPRNNEPDLADVPVEIRNSLTFHLVSTIDDAIQVAFDKQLGSSTKKQQTSPADLSNSTATLVSKL